MTLGEKKEVMLVQHCCEASVALGWAKPCVNTRRSKLVRCILEPVEGTRTRTNYFSTNLNRRFFEFLVMPEHGTQDADSDHDPYGVRILSNSSTAALWDLSPMYSSIPKHPWRTRGILLVCSRVHRLLSLTHATTTHQHKAKH